MPVSLPLPTKNPGDLLTSALWNGSVRDNLAKLLERGHRVLTVAQFAALTGLEGTKGTVAPDEVYLEVDSANGILWHLAYESGETTYKWRFLGGSPLRSTVATSEATASTAYVDLATVGPSITLSRAGQYDCDIASRGITNNVAGNGARTALKVGGAAAVDADSIYVGAAGANISDASVSRTLYGITAAASDVFKLVYKAENANSVTFTLRSLAIRPTRLV